MRGVSECFQVEHNRSQPGDVLIMLDDKALSVSAIKRLCEVVSLIFERVKGLPLYLTGPRGDQPRRPKVVYLDDIRMWIIARLAADEADGAWRYDYVERKWDYDPLAGRQLTCQLL